MMPETPPQVQLCYTPTRGEGSEPKELAHHGMVVTPGKPFSAAEPVARELIEKYKGRISVYKPAKPAAEPKLKKAHKKAKKGGK